jgi:transcriptional regulator with XRE-family HTH domain
MEKSSNRERDLAVGRRIRARRIERGMTQEKLGNTLGVTFQQVQKYEKGDNRIGAGRLQQIAEALEVPVAFFFDEQPGATAPATDVFKFLDTAAALRLLQAYSRIDDSATQHAITHLVECIAGGRSKR